MKPSVPGQFSDPLLVAGFQKRTLHFAHGTNVPIQFTLEMDAAGDGNWTTYKTVTVGTNGYAYELLPATFAAPWLRFAVDQTAPGDFGLPDLWQWRSRAGSGADRQPGSGQCRLRRCRKAFSR